MNLQGKAALKGSATPMVGLWVIVIVVMVFYLPGKGIVDG
jgi:hypothetical protein